jgi:hypothetical protein
MATLSADDIKNIITSAVGAAIAESRKPAPPSPEAVAAFKQSQEERRANAGYILQEKQNQKNFQQICSHEHSKREGGGTHCVHVQDNSVAGSPGYILCQKCQARIRPDDPTMRKLDPDATFNTLLFNKLFQDSNEGVFGG